MEKTHDKIKQISDNILSKKEMIFLGRNRYIQICKENDYSALYYDQFEKKVLRYRNESKFLFSLKYQLCILATLYLGYLLSDKFYNKLKENIELKAVLIFICLVISSVCLVLFENYIAKTLKEKGEEVPYIELANLLSKGRKDLRVQKRIISICCIISGAILFIFCITSYIIILVLFLASMISIAAMVAGTRPILRKKIYQRMEKM